MKTSLLLMLSLSLSMFSPQLSHSQPPDTLWTQTYGTADFDLSDCIQRKSDGNYCVLTTRRNLPDHISYVNTITSDGELIWARRLSTGYYRWFVPLENNQFAAIGYDIPFINDPYQFIFKIADDFDVGTRIFIGDPFRDDVGVHMCRTGTGGYMLVGWSRVYLQEERDGMIVCVDSEGEELWTDLLLWDDWEEIYWVSPTSDGNYLAAGKTNSFGFDEMNAFVYKFSPQGDSLWTKFYGEDIGGAFARCIYPVENGNFLLAGSHLVKMDEHGNIIWLSDISGHSITPSPHGGYYLIDEIEIDNPAQIDIILKKVSNDGLLEWEYIFGGDEDEYAGSLLMGHTGDLLFSGGTHSYGVGECSPWVVRFESEYGTPQIIPLQDNYFELISLNRTSANLTAGAVFGTLQNLIIAYANDGSVFIPELDIDGIGNLDVTQGYLLLSSELDTVVVYGDPISENTTYLLEPDRWNWLGYPFQYEVPVGVALEEAEQAISIVMNDEGRFWLPNYEPDPINTLGNMHPGEGYFVFATEEITFQYAENGDDDIEVVQDFSIKTQYTSIIRPTGQPYIVLVHLEDEINAQNPALIQIYDGKTLVGISDINDTDIVYPVICWEGFPKKKLDGFKKGNPILITVLDESGNIVGSNHKLYQSDDNVNGFTDSKTKIHHFGFGPYAEINISNGSQDPQLPNKFSVSTAYPNPFNPLTTVQINVPQNGIVGVAVYNLGGQKVYSKVEEYQAGTHSLLLDFSNMNNVSSGMYFLSVQYNSLVSSQKLILMK